MKKPALVILLIISLLPSAAAMEKDSSPLYANIHITLWKLEMGPSEAAERLSTPIPRVYTESFLSSSYSLDLSDGNSHNRSLAKEDVHIHLNMNTPCRMASFRVTKKGKERLHLIISNSASHHSIFYDEDSQAYLLDVGVTFSSHPIGLLSPGILRRPK